MKTMRWAMTVALAVLTAGAASAQDTEAAPNPDESVGWQGFSGLFNVVSPDTVDKGQVSFGVIDRNYDRENGDVDIHDFSVAFAVGVSDRLELAFAYAPVRRVDFDDFVTTGFLNSLPFPSSGWATGSGDMLLGGKFSIVRVEEQGPGLSFFGNVKVPIGAEDKGLGTGGVDVTFGAAGGVDKKPVSVYGNLSYTVVGDGDTPLGGAKLDLADSVRYGVGVEMLSQGWIRPVIELTGESFVRENTKAVYAGKTISQAKPLELNLGFKAGGAHHGGITVAGAFTRNLNMETKIAGRDSAPNGWVGEVSYTSYPRPLPPAPPPPPPPSAENHDPTASLVVNPRQVYPLWSPKVHAATATCNASDPDGDSLSYTWVSSGGVVTGSGVSATWTPPEDVETGDYTITCKVADGKGGQAQATAPVSLIPDAERPRGIGKVYFEFDRFNLSGDAKQMLDRVASHLKTNPTLKVKVEGHTCYIATEEYNLALGQHRADSIRTYLVGIGVEGSRLETISYGESRPWQDNSREVTRRLNRRGEFVFSFQPIL